MIAQSNTKVFVCPPFSPIASDRLRWCGLFAQISLIIVQHAYNQYR